MATKMLCGAQNWAAKRSARFEHLREPKDVRLTLDAPLAVASALRPPQGDFASAAN
jgi:hypothetical protein